MHYVTTLCYIESDNHLLMLFRNKKINDPNQGKWIGVGGKVEANETIDEAMKREVREETGLRVQAFQYRGIVHFDSNVLASETMHLYVVTQFSGELKECDEGTLAWVAKENLSTLPMWQGDQLFMALITKENPFFHLHLHYQGEKLIQAKLNDEFLDISQLR